MRWKLERNYIHRGICLPPDKFSNEDLIDHTITRINRQLSIENLTISIEDIHCQNEVSPVKTIDVILL